MIFDGDTIHLCPQTPSPDALFSIDVAAVADSQHEDGDGLIFNARDDTIVADAIFPEFAQARTVESLPNAARVSSRETRS